jgi:hypothetical protein
MRSDDIVIGILIIICPAVIAWSYYSWCGTVADRYNEACGTNYTPMDILMGVHKEPPPCCNPSRP